jgi:hypothetical protein
MKTLIAAVLLFAAIPSHAAVIAGKIDLTTLPAIGVWQSLQSTDQAIGVSKRFFHVDADAQPLLNVGLFAGGTKPLLSNAGQTTRFLMGETIGVPGSTLDWALGTTWGDKWVPQLKTGILIAHDWSRIHAMHILPDFIGAGVTWLWGSGA